MNNYKYYIDLTSLIQNFEPIMMYQEYLSRAGTTSEKPVMRIIYETDNLIINSIVHNSFLAFFQRQLRVKCHYNFLLALDHHPYE